jgi:hypothetical protein
VPVEVDPEMYNLEDPTYEELAQAIDDDPDFALVHLGDLIAPYVVIHEVDCEPVMTGEEADFLDALVPLGVGQFLVRPFHEAHTQPHRSTS